MGEGGGSTAGSRPGFDRLERSFRTILRASTVRRVWRCGGIATRKGAIAARILATLVPALQMSAILWMIWLRTPHVPWWDEWDEAPLVHAFERGRLRPADLLAFHNEHRIIIPRLIDLPIIEITHWNRQIAMTADLLIAIVAAWLLVDCARRAFARREWEFALIAPLSLLLLSLGTYEDWLWAFQITFIATVFGVALCLWALGTRSLGPAAYCLAVAGALIASLSSFAGLLLWFACLPVLWLCGYRRWWQSAIWMALALGVIVPYLHGFPAAPPRAVSWLDTAQFALAYLGAPIGPSVHTAQLAAGAGLPLMLGNLAYHWRRSPDRRPAAVWIGLALFSLACTAVTALGRGPASGIGQALASRYQLFSTLWWVALVVVAGLVLADIGRGSRESDRFRRLVWWVNLPFLVALCVGLVGANVRGFAAGRDWMALQQRYEQCVVYAVAASDDCLHLFFIPDRVRVAAAELAADRLSAFHTQSPLGALPRNPLPTRAAIDIIGPSKVDPSDQGPVRLVEGVPFAVTGWAVDVPAQAPASAVFVTVDDEPLLTDYGIDRPDVAQAFGATILRKTGFAASIRADGLVPGVHTLGLTVVAHDGRSYYEPLPTLQVDVRAQAAIPPVAPQTTSRWASIDDVNGLPVHPGEVVPVALSSGSRLSLSGSARDPSADRPAGAVLVCIDGVPIAYATPVEPRPDSAGEVYTAAVPAAAIGEGERRLTLRVVAADWQASYETPDAVILAAR
jgi:hypothetical protein